MYHYITGDHLNECPDLSVPCPVPDCTKHIKRCDLDEHKITCPQRLVPCTFKGIGCKSEVKLGNLQAHDNENIGQHLALAVTKINTQEQEITDLKESLRKVYDYLYQEVKNVKDQVKSHEESLSKVNNLSHGEVQSVKDQVKSQGESLNKVYAFLYHEVEKVKDEALETINYEIQKVNKKVAIRTVIIILVIAGIFLLTYII